MCDDTINLRTLKKNDDNIEEILMSVTQVAIYHFDRASGEWARKEIEGPLFFVRRKGPYEYGFFVINRLNTTNLSQHLTADLETSVSPPYMMYKSPDNEIYCVWFYDAAKLPLLHEEFRKVIEKLKQEKSLAQNLNGNQELLSFLGKLGNNTNDANNGQSEAEVVTAAATNPRGASRKAVNLGDLFNNTLQQQQQPQPPSSDPKPQISGLPKANLLGQKNSNNTSGNKDVAQLVPALNGLNLQKVSSFLKMDKKTPAKQQQQQPTNVEVAPSAANLNLMNDLAASITSKWTMVGGDTSKSSSSGYLTMEQLKQTLIYLLQNDADFLHMIHTTYVNMIKK